MMQKSPKLTHFGKGILLTGAIIVALLLTVGFLSAIQLPKTMEVPWQAYLIENCTDVQNIGDTRVYEALPDTNYGILNRISVGANGPVAWFESYIVFDLSNIPNGSTVNFAHLYTFVADTANTPNIELRRVTDTVNGSTWDESVLTWNNRLSYIDNLVSLENATIAAAGWENWTATNGVQAAVNENNKVAFGFFLQSGAEVYNSFASEEHATSPHPTLYIDYTTPPPPPSGITIENIITDNTPSLTWIDRDNDGGSPVENVYIETTVCAGLGWENIYHVRLSIFDNEDTKIIDNVAFSENILVDALRLRFAYNYNPNDALTDPQLGTFTIEVQALDNNGVENWDNAADNLLVVDDFVCLSYADNLTGHQIHIYGNVSLAGYDNFPATVTIVDNQYGTYLSPVPPDNDWENTYYSPSFGQYYAQVYENGLDGKSTTVYYEFPDMLPEIVSVSASVTLIDRDTDYAGSGAATSTTITVRLRDNDNRSELCDAWIGVRDNLNAVVDNDNVWTSWVAVDENQIDVTTTYTATDNTLVDNQLGPWDVWGFAMDNYGGTGENWTDAVFTVDDLVSTISFNPASPYVGWNLTVSGAHSRVTGGAVSIDASWLTDNRHGQFTLGASDTYNQTYTISDAGLDENVSVTLRTLDNPLDGVTVLSYKTNENVKFQVDVRFEENYELVGWVPHENRPLKLLFEWDGGTYPYTLTANPENIVVATGGIATKRVKLTDNNTTQNYWRYIIPDYPGGTLTFIVVNNPATVEQFRFFLQDYTTQYTPPNGQILVKFWIGTHLAGINADYWGADWRTTAWLVTGTQYQIWVQGEDAPLRLVGPIDAVVPSEEKTIAVQFVVSDFTPLFDDVYWAAWRVDDNTVRAEYQDNLDNTIEVHVGIYDMSSTLMVEYQPDNEWFIVTWLGANGTESYNVVLTIQHGIYGDYTLTALIGYMEGPPGVGGGVSDLFNLPTGLTLGALGSIIIVCVIGLAFDALRVQLGVLGMAFTALFFWVMGLLPLPGPWDGAFTAALILISAVLFALTWRRGK